MTATNKPGAATSAPDAPSCTNCRQDQHQLADQGSQVSKSLRESMPLTAAFIDDLRAHFGVDEINGQIRKGMAGLPVFYAREGGQEIGTCAPEGIGVNGTQMVLEKTIEKESRRK